MSQTGIIHVHSRFSHDGQHTLEEIVLLAKRRGYDFVGLTEHAESFDAEKMASLVQECQRLSTAELLLIPGVEFACGPDLHILGLGIQRFTNLLDPVAVARFVRAQGGLAIIAHPGRSHFTIPAGLETHVDGIEVWNARYDGRFVPDVRTIAFWDNLKGRARSLVAVGGQDLHEIRAQCHVKLSVACAVLEQPAILVAMRSGRLSISNSYFQFHPGIPTGRLQLGLIACAGWGYRCVREVVRAIKGKLRQLRRRKSAVRHRAVAPAHPAMRSEDPVPDGRPLEDVNK